MKTLKNIVKNAKSWAFPVFLSVGTLLSSFYTGYQDKKNIEEKNGKKMPNEYPFIVVYDRDRGGEPEETRVSSMGPYYPLPHLFSRKPTKEEIEWYKK